MRCAACGRVFTGTGSELRLVTWPHAETHAETDFPLERDGGRVCFIGEEVVLSCNCGECAFCRKRVPA